MNRRRLTQRFPWLVPLRTWQRKKCFYLAMALDGSQYCRVRSPQRLPHLLFRSACPMYNTQTGFDMRYQRNKVFNLKLAAAPLDGLIIGPGETFSFCQAVRHADRQVRYKEGLTVVDGRLTTAYGGGLCQLSNLLFWLFLHSPLTLVERHGHLVKDFPEPPSDAPMGVDATICEGWKDLKVRNDTPDRFQIGIQFQGENIVGSLYGDRESGVRYEIRNGPAHYLRRDGQIYQRVQVLRLTFRPGEGEPVSSPLYWNQCAIGYPLPAGTPVEGEGEQASGRR